MTDKPRAALLDAAALWILIGVALVALAVHFGHGLLLLAAWFPIRWGVARIARAVAPPAPAEAGFGYEPDEPTSAHWHCCGAPRGGPHAGPCNPGGPIR